MDHQYLVQDTLSDNQEIIDRIKSELFNAQTEILVAMAWFTNDELFDILLDRANHGVQVSVILPEHADNEKLDFEILDRSPNAEVIKIKNVGYGMMHQKFCVIDRKVAINGSYNWSKNAKNNHENVIVTNFSKTVEEFVRTFYNIKNRAMQVLNGSPLDEVQDNGNYITSKRDVVPIKKIGFQEQSLTEFKEVLDNIIATEVGSLDKDLIRQSAYNRAKDNNGDHQVLSQAMDSLYSNFINEIEVVSEKKTRLKNKIDEQLKLSVGNIEIKTDNQINSLKEKLEIEKQNLEKDLLLAEKEVEIFKSTIRSNENTQIPFLKNQINNLRLKINDQKIDFIKPPINWTKSILLCFVLFMLTAYIFVFYSSVAYIFIFSKEDINQAMLIGNHSNEVAEVFNAHAISKIWDKGLGGILFLFLFVSIPLALGMFKFLNVTPKATYNHLENSSEKFLNIISNWFKNNAGMVLIFIVDIFIAYKVAININEIEYLTRITEKRIDIWGILSGSNFWLVFVLGTLGVYLFSKVFENLIDAVNSRNQTHQHAIAKQIVMNLEKDIEKNESDINSIVKENDKLNSSIIVLETIENNLKHQLQQLPINYMNNINDLRQLLNSFSERIINLSNIYKSQIDNDKLPISKSEMENRCNLFIEGWTKYLYEFYSTHIAELKTKDAIAEIENWLNSLQISAELSSELKLNSLSISN